jgi:hypothetical protein
MDPVTSKSIDPSAPPCGFCGAAKGEACAAGCPGKLEACS